MKVRIGEEADKGYILKVRPQMESFFTENYFVVVEEETILGCATVFPSRKDGLFTADLTVAKACLPPVVQQNLPI